MHKGSSYIIFAAASRAALLSPSATVGGPAPGFPDLAEWVACVSGPNVVSVADSCLTYDLDNDHDVDLRDFAMAVHMPFCGDGTVTPPETCDPPGAPAGPSGNDCRADCTVCGDGNLDAGEDCDDGNDVNGDGCDNDCLYNCGDGTVTPPETCDPPGAPAGPSGNDCRADCTVCGDGNLDAGEDCDDGNDVNGDGCDNDCLYNCGDGTVTPPETCDPPGAPAGPSGNDCRADCTVCGDGNLDAGEDCDDGNDVNGDGCDNDCLYNCGDGTVTPPETCDPPGAPAGPSGNDCRADCTVCGDGNLDAGEDCDDGNDVNGDGCDNDCLYNCGDGTVTPPETCDPPGAPAGPSGNDCRADCTVCGDGNLDAGEDCDDGNDVNGDGCDNDCLYNCGDGTVTPPETCDPPGAPAGPSGNDCRADCTVCGDGNLDAGEDCDDGNDVNGDGCDNDCLYNCGDGTVTPPETCDPPGAPAGPSGNDCRADCTVCGDGNLDAGEDCDDGNDVNGDGCDNDCLYNCGDGTVTPPETCDPPGAPAGPSGNDCRADCTVCGDGNLDAGEDCDDGNDVNGDGCDNDCLYNCGDGTVTPPETCDPPGAPAGPSGNDCRADCTVCGDGNLDAGEDCDDGNDVNGDGCDNDCLYNCGDGTVTPPETCDPPGAPAGPSGNDCRADCTVCGDGNLDAGEDCDDGNDVNGDGCDNDCLYNCGDGTVTPPETCDPPGAPAGPSGNDCRADCTVCGDGNLDAGEDCDDGNDVNGDGCDNDCLYNCGDGTVTPPETCDPPGAPAGPSGNDCRADCTVCGDGNLDAGEDCDDGNDVNGDGCDNDCLYNCGDGTVTPPETCDPPGAPAGPSGNDCRADCTVCGDGNLDAGEDCDDGNDVNGDGCDNDCLYNCGDGTVTPPETCDPPGAPAGPSGNDCRADCTVCGDGNLDAGEDCDDGNDVNGDGCDNDCLYNCGDGTVTPPETCDPPGAPAGPSGNDCRADCTVCGDGNLDAGEDCDDGNDVNGDGCDNDCLYNCGDGTVTPPETCDPPGAPAGPSGNDCRADCTVCGDGNLDAGEDCDDGNDVNGDGCDNDCLYNCGDGVIDGDEQCEPPSTDVCSDSCQVIASGSFEANACENAGPILGTGLFAFDNTNATQDGPPHRDCVNVAMDNIDADVWGCWTAPCSSTTFVQTCGLTTVDTKIAVYNGCDCGALTDENLLSCNDDQCDVQSIATFEAQTGQQYLIRVGAFTSAVAGAGTISITCGLEACGPASGSCTEDNGGIGCNNETCCESVCAMDSFCCDTAWDDVCAGEAEGFCSGSFAACKVAAGACTKTSLAPGCADTDCCNTVCMRDPYCCLNVWDVDCVAEEAMYCSSSCGEDAGDCFAPVGTGSAGCNNPGCCAEVCIRDPHCCQTEWDGACAAMASVYCQ